MDNKKYIPTFSREEISLNNLIKQVHKFKLITKGKWLNFKIIFPSIMTNSKMIIVQTN